MALQSEVSPPIVGDPNKDTQIEGETKSDDNESCQSSDDTVDLEEGEILDSGAEEEEEKDFSKSSLKEALDKSLVQNIEQLANHKGNAKSEASPDHKAASSRQQKKMAANYMDPDRINDVDEEDGWFPGSPKFKSKYNDKPVDYRMELEAYRGTPPSSPDRKRRDEKSKKKKSSKKSKKTRKTIRRKDIKGVRVAKYKKDAARGRICKFFKEGKCAKGADCMYSHSSPPPPFKKKELCKFYLNGHCNKGKDCLYMHSEFPCKFYHTGSECYAKDDCRFSHAPLNDEMKRVLHDYLRISHGDDVRLRFDDDRDGDRTGNNRERDRDRDRDRKRRRSCSPEQPRGPPPKRTCLLGSPPRHIREAEETKRWQEEMKQLQQQQPGFEIHLSPDPEDGSAHFKPNFYQETLLNTPSPKKRPPNPETPNSFHGNTSNNYYHESPSKVYIYDDDEFIEIDLPPSPTKQEPPEEFHWDNVRSMTPPEENHIKPFHENSQQDLDFTNDVKFDETTQFSEMESSTDCPPNLSPSLTPIHDFKDNDEASSQGPVTKIKEEKFSDEETNASSQEAPAPPIVIPSHLPPKQRELLKRVLHNNQKKKTADAPGSPSANEGTDVETKKEESDVEEKVEAESKDNKWYSSEDDDDDDDTVQPLTAVLKRIQQDPPKPVVQETKPSLKLLDMFQHIQRKGKNQESSNSQAQQQKQSQNQFWENLFGGKPPSLPLPVANSNNTTPSEPKRRTLLPDPVLPPTKVEPAAPKDSVHIKDPRLKNRDPRKLANMPVPAPKIESISIPPVLAQNANAVKPAVSSEPSKESIPYKLRGISAKPPNYSPLIHASQSNPNLLKDPRLRKHLTPSTNSDAIGNGKDSAVVTKPPVQSKGIPPIPELLLKYAPLKAINIFESSSKPAVKAEEPKPAPVVYDPRRLRRDSRSNSGSDTPPHLTIIDTAPEEKSAPVLENEKEFGEEKKWLPPVLERNWAPPVLERNWASIVDKPLIQKEVDEEQPSISLETSAKSPPKESSSPPPSTKEEFITVIKKEPSPVAASNAHPVVPPLIIKKVKPTPPASHLPRAMADPRMARLHNRNSRPLISSDTNPKSIVERKILTPAEPSKTNVDVTVDSPNSSEMPDSMNHTESTSAEEVSEKASKEEKPKSAKSIPKKRRLSDKSDEKKKTVHRNRKSSMDYASPLNSCDASKDSKSSGYNSYNQRPKRSVPPHNERLSPNTSVSSSVMDTSDNSMPEFIISDSSNLECDNSSDVNLRDRFKTIDPTASPFC